MTRYIMFSDPQHDHIVHNIDNQNHLIACFEDAMINNLDIENCFGNYGQEVAVWADGHHYGHCCQTLGIKADFWWNYHMHPQHLVHQIRDYIRNCPAVERIIVQGSEFSMKSMKLITSKGRIDSKFSAFIAGINVLKGPPVVLTCMTLRGAGPTQHVVTDHCI